MASDRLSELNQLQQSDDYPAIADKLGSQFSSETEQILSKWTSNTRLTTDERTYMNLLSSIEFSVVNYCYTKYNQGENDHTTTDKFRKALFRDKQIKSLTDAVYFIREDQDYHPDDEMILYIIRMIDARALAHRLCSQTLQFHPDQLNNELFDCLNHRRAKACLDSIITPEEVSRRISPHRHRFFLGCATFSVGFYQRSQGKFSQEDHEKYVFRLVKYIRVVLKKNSFDTDEVYIYCLRGIFTLISSRIWNESWMKVINVALANPDDDDAQRRNPFNLDLFSSIFSKLIGSKILQDNARKNASNTGALLIDMALVFLYRCCYTSGNQTTADDDEDNDTSKPKNDQSSERKIPNQVVRFLHSTEDSANGPSKGEIIYSYIDAKYDRIRLMAFAILVNVMDYSSYKYLTESQPNIGRDLLQLIFDFLDKADQNPGRREYKGISFDLLLRFLLRFAIQDFIKQETIEYLPKLIQYADRGDLYALRIIRRISSNPKLKEKLAEVVELQQLLQNIPNYDELRRKIAEQIQENLRPEPTQTLVSPLINSTNNQAFISYCHEDKAQRRKLYEELKSAEIFKTIWVDEDKMEGRMTDTIPQAILQSKAVFVLVSEDYCKSDICRHEWEYAFKKKISIYVVLANKKFKQHQYDWVEFLIGHNLYYRIDSKESMDKLIEELQKKFLDAPKSVTFTVKPSLSTEKRFSSKPSLHQWTQEDIQDWCVDCDFVKWMPLLRSYDGDCLLALHRTLCIDANLSNFIQIDGLNIVEVIRFKHRLDQLVSKTFAWENNRRNQSPMLKLSPK